MDMWITLVYLAIIGGILWSVLSLTRRSVQSLRRRAAGASGSPARPGLAAAALENGAGISVKGADK